MDLEHLLDNKNIGHGNIYWIQILDLGTFIGYKHWTWEHSLLDIQTLDIGTLLYRWTFDLFMLDMTSFSELCTFYDADLLWFISKSPDLVEGSTTPRQ